NSVHQIRASISTCPGAGRWTECSRTATSRTVPSRATSTPLVLDMPTSTPRTASVRVDIESRPPGRRSGLPRRSGLRWRSRGTRPPADVRFHPAIECSVLPASPPDGEVAWPLRCGADEVSGTMGGYRIIAHSAPGAAHGLFARGGAQAVTERRCRRARDVDGFADAASRRVLVLPR